MSVFNLRMRVCSSINLSVAIKFTFNITHSRSQIEWSSLLNCLVTGIYIYIYILIQCDLQ